MRILILCLSVLIMSGSMAQAQDVYNGSGSSNGFSRSSSSSEYMKTRKSGSSGPISIKGMLAKKSTSSRSSRSAYSSRSKASAPFSFDGASQKNGSIYSGLDSKQIRANRAEAAEKAQEYRERTAKERAERQARYAVQRGSVDERTNDYKNRFGAQTREEEEEEILYRKKAKKKISPYLEKDKNDLKIPPRVFNSNY